MPSIGVDIAQHSPVEEVFHCEHVNRNEFSWCQELVVHRGIDGKILKSFLSFCLGHRPSPPP